MNRDLINSKKLICSFLGNSPASGSNCRRFGTHYRFHLHRQVNEVCQIVRGIYIWLGLERGSGRANRKWVPVRGG